MSRVVEEPAVFDKMKGKANEAIGDLTADDAQKARGQAQIAKGEYKQRVDKANDLEKKDI